MRKKRVTLYYHDEGANPCQPIRFAKPSLKTDLSQTT